MRYGDCAAGGLFAACGVIVIAAAWPLEFWLEFGPGPGFLPLLLGAGVVGLGTVVAVTGWLAHKTSPGARGDVRKPMRVAGVVMGYLALLGVAGFTLATGLFVFTLLAWVESRKAWQALVLAVLTALGFHVVFVTLLNIPLPVGVLL